MGKQCKKCKEIKDKDCFGKHSIAKDGLRNYCKKCNNLQAQQRRHFDPNKSLAYVHKWRIKNLEKYKGYQLNRRYGITLVEYNLMVDLQDNKCAICKLPEITIDKRNGLVRNLCVDHCHKTGKIRSLLCSNCNITLGNIKDNLETLKSIQEYLVKHNG